MRPILLLLVFLQAATLSAQQRKVVVLPNAIPGAVISAAELGEFRKAAPSLLIVVPAADQAVAEAATADAIIGPASPDMLRAARNLKWLQTQSAGVERYLTPEFKQSSVILTNGRIVQGPEIADHAMALLLSLTRNLHRYIPQREWGSRDAPLVELRGKTAVVVGVGGIGTQIAVRAHAFGMKVIGVDAHDLPLMPFLERAVRPDRLDEVLPLADVLFLSVPHTPESERMIGPRQFSLMPKNSYFIAVSRGKIYDMNGLVQALDSKRLAGAGVDVTDPEPLPKDHALWKFENAVITPHIAGRSDGEHARYIELYRENLRRFANNQPLLHVVDKAKGY